MINYRGVSLLKSPYKLSMTTLGLIINIYNYVKLVKNTTFTRF